MASILIHYWEAEKCLLPKLCIACGEPASASIRRVYTGLPDGSPAAALGLGLDPIGTGVGLAYDLANNLHRIVVEAPVCRRHRGYWGKRQLLMIVPTFLLIVAALFLGLPDERLTEIRAYAGPAVVIGLLVWIPVAVYIRFTMVRYAGMTEDAVCLRGVDGRFAAALVQMRRANPGP